MGRTDILVGTIMLFFSLTAYILTLPFPGGESVSSGLGPAFFPRLVIFCMLTLGCAILISGFFTLKQNITLDLKMVDMGSSFLLLVITGGYILLMNFFGFFIATPIFLIGAMIMWRVKWYKAFMIGIGLTCVLYVFVKIILRIPLPKGTFLGGF